MASSDVSSAKSNRPITASVRTSQEQTRKVRAASAVWLRWAVPASCLALAIASVPVMVLNEKGLPRYRALQTQVRQVDAQNAALERRVRTLSHEVSALTHDTATVERAARERFGMVREDELVFLFPD